VTVPPKVLMKIDLGKPLLFKPGGGTTMKIFSSIDLESPVYSIDTTTWELTDVSLSVVTSIPVRPLKIVKRGYNLKHSQIDSTRGRGLLAASN
jgi:hypothetical protein